jgi:hypothetical protein
MKKIISLAVGILMAATAFPQRVTFTENFDGNAVSYISSPANAWTKNSNYFMSTPYSYRGMAPHRIGDSIVLTTTQLYDFSNYDYVQLQFNHICKISPRDRVMIEYRISGQTWQALPAKSYSGEADNYAATGFHAGSYPEWKSNDSTAMPAQSWWKEEVFDISANVNRAAGVQFRFILKRGNTHGSHVSYGWLLDDIKITASATEIGNPVVEFLSPLVTDTVYTAGPFEINAKVKNTTPVSLETPILKYTAYRNGATVATDSVVMTSVRGDSLWKATLPQFEQGTLVTYSVTGKDTTGNKTTARSEYYIQKPREGALTGYVTVGTGTTVSNSTPLDLFYQNSWTRQLYLGSEICPSGGLITHLAWQYRTGAPSVIANNQTCYMKAVDDNYITSRQYEDPVSAGGTQVWTGSLTVAPGWVEIALDNPFMLPPGKNLLIYWDQAHGIFYSQAYSWYHTPTSLTMAAHAHCDCGGLGWDPKTAEGNTLSTSRPNARFYILGSLNLDNSVAMHSINMVDTVMTKPGLQVPVVATIKNKGITDLLSAEIHYSVNGGTVHTKNWTGNLPWDFDHQDTLGYYTPKANGNDSIAVWVNLPNGQYDSASMDDTLLKVIYGSADIRMNFVNSPADTVNNTGPFAINARIHTLSGAAVGQVSLSVLTSYNGATTPAVLQMMYDAADNLWKTTIPHTLSGSDVAYSIHLTDIFNNTVSIGDRFYIDFKSLSKDSNSVALEKIISPDSRREPSNTSVAVCVQIRNKGIKDLTFCKINWSRNGVLQQPETIYSRVLPTDFTDTVTIGYYVPLSEQRDTIAVWVSEPNRETDSIQTDDTLRVFPTGCDGLLAGVRTVGAAGADFPTMAAVSDLISDCGLAGDLTLQLKGTLNENIDLARISPFLGGYHLTITSLDNHADSAVIRASSGNAVVLGDNKNITIKALTIDAKAGYGIQFTAACRNIVIRDCKIFTDTTATASIAPIAKAVNTGIADSVFIVKNILNGGYHGILFYGGTGIGTGAFGTNIVIDSNTISNQYFYGVNIYYSDLARCSYNTILSRKTHTGVSWQGLRLYYANGPVVGNRILQRSNAITSPCGMYTYYYNVYNTTDTGLIANNEIIVNVAEDTYYGLYTSASQTAIYHNSIYVSGKASARALYISATSDDLYRIKNNNIVATSVGSYPVYLSSTSFLSRYDIDNNNMYAPIYAGFAGNDKMSIAEWQQTVVSDRHSVSLMPSFVDPGKSLELTNYIPFYTSLLQNLPNDILNVSRIGMTALGCYHGTPSCTVNASLLDLTGCNSGVLYGMQDTVKAVFSNLTATPVTNALLGWSYNGTPQSAVSWSGNLTVGQTDTVVLGVITHSAQGYYSVSAWINSLGSLTDEYPKDDTVTAGGLICSAPYGGGVYRVGVSNSDFPSLSDAFDAFSACGLTGDAVLELRSGTYEQSINLAKRSSVFGNNTLTITSATHKAEDVILVTKSVGILLANSNIVIKDITIDATEGKYAIQFINACTNVVIRDCRLLSNPTTTVAGTAPVYKAAGTGLADSIFIINNLLDGGYWGFYFYGGTGTGVGQYGKNIVFDSNTVSNQHYQAVSPCYLNYISCSYNTVQAREKNANDAWEGMRVYYVNGPVVGNRIIQRASISSPNHMYVAYYHAHNTRDTGLIANNEIIANANANGSNIISLYASRARILHNSLYVSGSKTAYGMYLLGSYIEWYEIKNNNIVMEYATSFPLYLSTASFLDQYEIDNNNMYAPQYVGYVGTAKKTIAEWQQTVTGDTHSISVCPVFTDNTKDLQLAVYSPFFTAPVKHVTHDIARISRFGNITAMGCYHGITFYNANASLTDLHGGREGLIAGQQDTIKVLLFNGGVASLTNVNLGWSHNSVTMPSVSWSGNLAFGETDTVVLGVITHSASGIYTLSSWINNLGSLTDELPDDDTVSTSGLICASPMSGTYTIGVNSDFSDISEALKVLNLCTAGGDIVFEIETGTYNQSINLSNINSLLGGNKLTLTSATHRADDVVFVSTGTGVTLGNSNNIVLKDLTINARTGNCAIEFVAACTNVVIRNCKLLADTATTSSFIAVISKTSGTGIVDSIFIVNNLLDGGYYGLRFYAGTGSGLGEYGTNIVFDSNTVSNQYYYALYPNYTDFTSCSHNTVLSRTKNIYRYWYGMRIYYSNGNIIGNRILQRTNAITNPSLIYIQYHNFYNTEKAGLLANNEIIMYATSSNSAIYTAYSHVKILHNSIYVSGSGAARGIFVSGFSKDELYEIKNNNISMTSLNAYPLYVNALSYIDKYDIDGNNMYAPQYVGYAGGNKATIAMWQQTVTTDKHSVSVQPSFVDSKQHLKLNDYTPFKCDIHQLIERDKEDSIRTGAFTAMGAYHGFSPLSANASLTEIVNLREGAVLGQTDNMGVILYNTGSSPLTEANISWTFNGVSQPSVAWTGSLVYGESATVNLGSITYTPLINTAKVWIDNLGALTDVYVQDDTVSIEKYVCSGAMNGVYTIGTAAGNDYATLAEALHHVKLCGIDANTVFELQADTYRYDIDLSKVGSTGGNTLTITSATHNATDVVFVTKDVGVKLSDSRNIVLKDITIDATGGMHAVQFTAACTNIVIRDCRLSASPTTTSNAISVIEKAQKSGIVDSIFIINNLLDGGYYGFNFYAGTGINNGEYGTNIRFDSNTLSNQYYCGFYADFADFISCSYNTILSRTENEYTYWYAMRMYYSNCSAIGNRMLQRTNNILYPSLMDINFCNLYNTTKMGVIANNEIIMKSIGSTSAIYVKSSRLKILHNSIHVFGAGTERGIFVSDDKETWVEVKNNNIVMESSNAYPVYLHTTTYLNQYDMDYNNMYAPQYIGYAGSNKTTVADWQQTILSDLHSFSVLPAFPDTITDLKLSSPNRFLCPLHSEVSVDINNMTRPALTTVGAYTQQTVTHDAMLKGITAWEEGFLQDQQLQVHVDLLNLCDNTPVTTAALGWSVNDVPQKDTVLNFSPAIQPYDVRNVVVGAFTAPATDTVKVSVRLESINGQKDTINGEDTVSAFSFRQPLAAFAFPFVADTVAMLHFTVNTLIHTQTGAPAVTPKMYFHTAINDNETFYDSVVMVQKGNIWQADIPSQYYNSKVVYSTTVFDATGNSITLTDSTYIRYRPLSAEDTLRIVGTGKSITEFSPYHSYHDKGWSRSIYMDWEIDAYKRGGTITRIAYKDTAADRVTVNSLSMYFKAVTDSVITHAAYTDPVADGAILVWGKASKVADFGLVVFDLDTVFHLPPNSNLMVYWNNEDGSWRDNGGSVNWVCTSAPNKNIYSYADGSAFPTTENITISDARPNAQFTIFGVNDKYAGNNLSILELTDPVNRNIGGKSCSESHEPLKIVLANTGENDYDFSVNSVTLHVEVSNAITYTAVKTLTGDVLLSGEVRTIEIDSALPVFMPGQYDIKVWLTSAIDNISFDDTIRSVYMSERLGVPIADNFSGSVSSDFVIQAVNTPANWTVVSQGTGIDTAVKPVYGTGMLAFTGDRGAMSYLSTRQLELTGTVLPVLEFWYFHDTVESDDYMDVLVTGDGGATYTVLKSVLKQDVDYGWKQYSIHLAPYVGGQCMNILFEVMQMTSNVTQYIDSINITAKQDIAIKEVLIPELTACDLANKAWRVVLENLADPMIDYTKNPTQITLEIMGTPYRFERSLTGGALAGLSLDTVTLSPTMNFDAGKYDVRVYFTSAIDENPLNDTLKTSVTVNPNLSILIRKLSAGPGNPAQAEIECKQEVTITNTGNLELPNIKLILKVLDGTGFTDTIRIGHSLLPNHSEKIVFNKAYTVPWLAQYLVEVYAYLECDPLILNKMTSVQENVNMTDLYIVDVTHPVVGIADVAGSAVNVSLRIQNRNLGDIYNEGSAEVGILIKDEHGALLSSVNLEELPEIGSAEMISYTFKGAYTVPSVGKYYLTVYLNSVDAYPVNDTVCLERMTNVSTSRRNAFAFGMEQNIPNPTSESTIIRYSVPQDGEVIFQIYSVSGQLLYTKKENVPFGEHQIALNLSDYAVGIYFYTMEYRGQRLVKRMSIRR